MISIQNKANCCGCESCVQKCPKQCISLIEDNEGFLYPHVNEEICIDCGLCEKVCPVINQGEPREPLNVYAAMNKNEEVRLNSSSGGLFHLLAEQTIKEKGVVFGAMFNNEWKVVHSYTETIEGIKSFQGSKYVQSQIEDSFKQAELFLKQERKVLFTGTPCQIAGLKLFLKKNYNNLLTVDFVCHGVPSPKIWRMYLKRLVLQKKIHNIKYINFRDKLIGWKSFHFNISYTSHSIFQKEKASHFSEPHYKNIFMLGFLQNLTIRPSCYLCPAKRFKSTSDITLGDFWGIEKIMPTFDDDKGCSLVCYSSSKGLSTISSDLLFIPIENQHETFLYNPALMESVPYNTARKDFYKSLNRDDIWTFLNRLYQINNYKRRVKKIKSMLNRLRHEKK